MCFYVRNTRPRKRDEDKEHDREGNIQWKKLRIEKNEIGSNKNRSKSRSNNTNIISNTDWLTQTATVSSHPILYQSLCVCSPSLILCLIRPSMFVSTDTICTYKCMGNVRVNQEYYFGCLCIHSAFRKWTNNIEWYSFQIETNNSDQWCTKNTYRDRAMLIFNEPFQYSILFHKNMNRNQAQTEHSIRSCVLIWCNWTVQINSKQILTRKIVKEKRNGVRWFGFFILLLLLLLLSFNETETTQRATGCYKFQWTHNRKN